MLLVRLYNEKERRQLPVDYQKSITKLQIGMIIEERTCQIGTYIYIYYMVDNDL